MAHLTPFHVQKKREGRVSAQCSPCGVQAAEAWQQPHPGWVEQEIK
jgi:hypothetical protein